jgi:hypothetical protein
MKRPVYRGQRGLYSRGAITGRKGRPSEAEKTPICGRNIYIYISLLKWSVFHGFPDVVFPCSLLDLHFFLPSPGSLRVYILWPFSFRDPLTVCLPYKPVTIDSFNKRYFYFHPLPISAYLTFSTTFYDRYNNSPNYY